MDLMQIRVSSKSNPLKVSTVIANRIKEGKQIEIQAIGAYTVNIATKAIVLARGFLSQYGMNLISIPSFYLTTIGDTAYRGIKFELRA